MYYDTGKEIIPEIRSDGAYTAPPAEVVCPGCNETYCLHHSRVEIFNREEDDTTGLHVDVKRNSLTVDENVSGNPSARRSGLTIYFWCEHCQGMELRWHIYQHKGITLTHMEMHPDPDCPEKPL